MAHKIESATALRVLFVFFPGRQMDYLWGMKKGRVHIMGFPLFLWSETAIRPVFPCLMAVNIGLRIKCLETVALPRNVHLGMMQRGDRPYKAACVALF